MITLKRLNEVRQVASEERAAKLEQKGFTRIGGSAEAKGRPAVSYTHLRPAPRPGFTSQLRRCSRPAIRLCVSRRCSRM